jgi:predicted ATPase
VYRAAFVGRERELEALSGLLDAVRVGHGSLILIDGEPGMGKTALASEVVFRARERGWVTAWGSCQESEAAPAYWPWIQVLRDLDGVGDLFVEQDDGGRFRLFDEVIEVLRRSSMEGLLIVLDDLHWADLVSVQLLLVLAAEIAEHRVLVLGLYRRADLDSRGNEVLSAVARERATSQLTLGGCPVPPGAAPA